MSFGKEYLPFDAMRPLIRTNLSEYTSVRDSIQEHIETMYFRLGHIFAQRGAEKWKAEEHMPTTITHSVVAREQTTTTFKGTEVAKLEEKDYAITLLVDLSGSMEGESMRETFKGVVAMAEVLSQLNIPTEIVGFNDKMYLFKAFDEAMTDQIRGKIGTMPTHVGRTTRNGWALSEVSKRLAKQPETVKAVLVFSDGAPNDKEPEYDLHQVIADIERSPKRRDQILVGVGLGSGTTYVKDYYTKAYVAGIPFDQMSEILPGVLEDVLNRPDMFVDRAVTYAQQ